MLSSAIHYGDPKLQMPPRGSLNRRMSPSSISGSKTVCRGPKMTFAPPQPRSPKLSAISGLIIHQFELRFRMSIQPGRRTDIDRFVLASLEQKQLKVGADTDKRTLLRRVTYDLTGLPPTPEEEFAFAVDKSPKAYEHVVDRLLASKSYGERWGRIWLDVVRYADTTGGGGDFPIPQVYKYRNYVIDSFNQDKPYDRFIREQIAGDLLPAASEQEHWNNIVATGYLAGASTYDRAQIQDAVDNLGYAIPWHYVSVCALSRSQIRPHSYFRLLRHRRHPQKHDLSPTPAMTTYVIKRALSIATRCCRASRHQSFPGSAKAHCGRNFGCSSTPGNL